MAGVEDVRGGGLRIGRAPALGRRAGSSGGAFGVATPEAAETRLVGAASCLTGLDGLLAMQEAETSEVGERQARRHGQTILAELTRLQLSLLGAGTMPTSELTRLAELVEAVPFSADAGLRAVLQSIALRAKIELARR